LGIDFDHDYHHGKDFTDEELQIKQQIFASLNRKNVGLYLKYFGEHRWDKIDFYSVPRFIIHNYPDTTFL